MASTPFVDLYAHLYHVSPPPRVEVGSSEADVLSPSRGFMEGFDYTLQLMVGCPAGCVFCYVRTAPRLAPADIRGSGGQAWGYQIRRKRDALEKFGRHLNAGTLADKTLYWSGVTDPYASEPALTYGLWQTLLSAPRALRPRRLVVQTRFPADRDAEIMAAYAADTRPSDGGPATVISYSLGTDRDDLISAWEKGTPAFARRMKTLETLAGTGLFVVVTLSPMALWNDLTGTLQRLKEIGVPYITLLFFKAGTASANTPPAFLEYLRVHYPQLLDPQWQQARLEEVEAVWGTERVLTGQSGFASLAAPHRTAGFTGE